MIELAHSKKAKLAHKAFESEQQKKKENNIFKTHKQILYIDICVCK